MAGTFPFAAKRGSAKKSAPKGKSSGKSSGSKKALPPFMRKGSAPPPPKKNPFRAGPPMPPPGGPPMGGPPPGGPMPFKRGGKMTLAKDMADDKKRGIKPGSPADKKLDKERGLPAYKTGGKVTLKPTKKGQKPITFKPGGLHSTTGTPAGKPIPSSKFRKALSGGFGPKGKEQAEMAKNVFGKKA